MGINVVVFCVHSVDNFDGGDTFKNLNWQGKYLNKLNPACDLYTVLINLNTGDPKNGSIYTDVVDKNLFL